MKQLKKIKKNLINITVLTILINFQNLLLAIDYRPYFVGGNVSMGVSSFETSCEGQKESLSNGYGGQIGFRGEKYRFYTAYDSVNWKDADATIFSFNADYLIPLINTKKRVRMDIYKMLSFYFGVNVNYIKFSAFNRSDTKINMINPISLFGTNLSFGNFGFQTGLLYDINTRWNIDFSYRYFPLSLRLNTEQNNSIKIKDIHRLLIGVAYKFGGEIKDIKEVRKLKVERRVQPPKTTSIKTLKPILTPPPPIVIAPIPKIVLPKSFKSKTTKCKNVKPCTVVDNNGCPLKIKLKVLFPRDKYFYNNKYDKNLAMVKEILDKNKTLKVLIQGFTDSKNTKRYNLKLSKNRAKSIRNRLIKLGVDGNRIKYQGYGEGNPVATNKTKAGRAKNRRVEAEFYKEDFYSKDGCKLKDIRLKINFDTNSSLLRDKYDAEILEVAKVLKIRDDLDVKIEGHTDNRNSAKYNIKLSKQRANSVRRRLVEFGIDSNRITTFGYGEEYPIDTNKTAKGRENNRRVEAKFIKR